MAEPTKPISGGCMCGAIRYEASEPPIEVYEFVLDFACREMEDAVLLADLPKDKRVATANPTIPVHPENAARAPKGTSSATVAESAQHRKLADPLSRYDSPIAAAHTSGPRPSGRAEVPMMKPAEHGPRAQFPEGLDAARGRRISVERLMRTRGVVVVDVLPKRAQQMSPAERDDVIRALAADGTDDALHKRVLPRTAASQHRTRA